MAIIRLLLIDDHDLVLTGLATAFAEHDDFCVVGTATSAEEGLVLARACEPDVILTDLRMRGMGGLELIKLITAEFPDMKVVVLTVSDAEGDVEAALSAGAAGYLNKETPLEGMVQVLRLLVSTGGLFLPASARRLLGGAGAGPVEGLGVRDAGLTPRELQIYQLMALNYSNKEIAAELHIAEPTVKTHVSRILSKLKQPNRAQAVIYGMQRGIALIS